MKNSPQSKTKVHYFARGGNIARTGPFKSALEAWEALRTTEGEPIQNATVWPERVKA